MQKEPSVSEQLPWSLLADGCVLRNFRMFHSVMCYLSSYTALSGFPGGVSGKELSCQCRRCKRCKFDPWVGKMSWKRSGQPTLVFLPGESPWTEKPGGLQSIGLYRVRHDWSDLARTENQILRFRLFVKTYEIRCELSWAMHQWIETDLKAFEIYLGFI